MRSTMLSALGVLLAALLLGGVFAPIAVAGEDPDKDRAEWEVRLVMRRIHELVQKAKALREDGQDDAAAGLEAQAEDLERRLKRHHARAKQAHDGDGHARRSEGEKLERIVHGLVAGIEALHHLGGQEKVVAHLKHLVAELKRKHAEGERRHHERERARDAEGEEEHAERRGLKERMEALRLAHVALREGEKREAAELIELTIHAGELLLEGRQDEEAREVYGRIPGLEARVRLLRMAAHLWREFEEPPKAKAVENLARYYAQRLEGHERERAERAEHAERRKKERRPTDREHMEHEIELMRLGMKALLEGEKKDWAHKLEHAIHAVELILKGRKDPEAREIIADAPHVGHRAELLHVAAKLWREFGQPEKAEMVEKLVKHYGALWRKQEQRRAMKKMPAAQPKRADHKRDELLEHLQKEMVELQRALQRMQKQLRELQRDR